MSLSRQITPTTGGCRFSQSLGLQNLKTPIAQAGPFTPGGAAADFAGKFLSTLSPTAYFALRNTTWGAVGGGFYTLNGSGNFDASGTQISITGGTSELQVGTTVLPPAAASLNATNGASSGNLSEVGSQLVLSLPISAVSIQGSEFRYTLTGNIVATAVLIPEPSSLVLAAMALVALALVARRRMPV